jgi:hypothetical protein
MSHKDFVVSALANLGTTPVRSVPLRNDCLKVPAGHKFRVFFQFRRREKEAAICVPEGNAHLTQVAHIQSLSPKARGQRRQVAKIRQNSPILSY